MPKLEIPDVVELQSLPRERFSKNTLNEIANLFAKGRKDEGIANDLHIDIRQIRNLPFLDAERWRIAFEFAVECYLQQMANEAVMALNRLSESSDSECATKAQKILKKWVTRSIASGSVKKKSTKEVRSEPPPLQIPLNDELLGRLTDEERMHVVLLGYVLFERYAERDRNMAIYKTHVAVEQFLQWLVDRRSPVVDQ
jgi:hypothetical protein